jgi:hypothetical protein
MLQDCSKNYSRDSNDLLIATNGLDKRIALLTIIVYITKIISQIYKSVKNDFFF